MARQLKPLEVDEIRDEKTGEKVKIYLDRNENIFFFRLDNERHEADTANDCKTVARKKLEERRVFTWKPVIRIERENREWMHNHRDNTLSASVQVEFKRIEIAQKPDGKWIQRPFFNEKGLMDTDDLEALLEHQRPGLIARRKEDRSSGEDISTYWPPDSKKESDDVQLDYDEGIWTALCAVRERIQSAKTQLAGVLAAEDLGKRLKLVASKMRLLPEKT